MQSALDGLFDRQYKLTVTETVETRYRTETDETGEDAEVAYDYTILNVTLVNNGLGGIAAADLDTEKLELYAVYMEMRGSKSYLFENEHLTPIRGRTRITKSLRKPSRMKTSRR